MYRSGPARSKVLESGSIYLLHTSAKKSDPQGRFSSMPAQMRTERSRSVSQDHAPVASVNVSFGMRAICWHCLGKVIDLDAHDTSFTTLVSHGPVKLLASVL